MTSGTDGTTGNSDDLPGGGDESAGAAILADPVVIALTPPAEPPPVGVLVSSTAADPAQRRLLAAPFRTGLLVGIGLLLAYALYLSLSTLLSTLVVLAISALLAVGLDPVVRLLTRHGMRRGLAAAITFFGLLAVLGGAIYAIIPPVVQEVVALIKVAPDKLKQLLEDPTISSLDERFKLIEKVQDYLSNVGAGAASGVFTAAGVAVDLLVVLVLTLYFLLGLPRILDASYGLVPASRRARVREIGDKVISQMGGYLGGALVIALQAGLVAGLFAWFVGLPYPLAIGAGAFVLDFVPVVGPIIIGVAMALLGFTQSIVVGIVAAAFYIGQHLFEAYWLYPRVMRRAVHISSAAVIVAIIIGAALLGVVGAVLAVPVAAALQLIIREVVLPRQNRT